MSLRAAINNTRASMRRKLVPSKYFAPNCEPISPPAKAAMTNPNAGFMMSWSETARPATPASEFTRMNIADNVAADFMVVQRK